MIHPGSTLPTFLAEVVGCGSKIGALVNGMDDLTCGPIPGLILSHSHVAGAKSVGNEKCNEPFGDALN